MIAVILPHGMLLRGGGKERIRTKLLKDEHIDTVITLPTNLFYSTGIPVCILVLKKCKKPYDVLFINAAQHFEKGKQRQNEMMDEHIAKIVGRRKSGILGASRWRRSPSLSRDMAPGTSTLKPHCRCNSRCWFALHIISPDEPKVMQEHLIHRRNHVSIPTSRGEEIWGGSKAKLLVK
jgi:hypothetical protein